MPTQSSRGRISQFGASAIDKVLAFVARTHSTFWLMVPALLWMAVSRVLRLGGLAMIGRTGGLPLGPSLYLLAVAGYFLAVTGPVTGVEYPPADRAAARLLLLAESGLWIATRRAPSGRFPRRDNDRTSRAARGPRGYENG